MKRTDVHHAAIPHSPPDDAVRRCLRRCDAVFIAQAMLGHPDLGDLGTVIFIATFGWLLIGTFATNLLIRRGVQSFAGVPIAAPRSAARRKVGRPISVPNYTQNPKDC